jgi:chemotaxis protein CheD
MAPEHILEIFLMPGDFYWGDQNTRIRTILGSCISICVWHPIKRFGGMCHYMLPERKIKNEKSNRLDGKYGNEAWELFLVEMEKSKSKPVEFVSKIFGGSEMFSKQELLSTDIAMGRKNVEFAKEILTKHKIQIVSENIGGNRPRRIHFDIWSGNVWLKRE